MSLKHLDVQSPWFSHESSQSCPPNGTQDRAFQNLQRAGTMATQTQTPNNQPMANAGSLH